MAFQSPEKKAQKAAAKAETIETRSASDAVETVETAAEDNVMPMPAPVGDDATDMDAPKKKGDGKSPLMLRFLPSDKEAIKNFCDGRGMKMASWAHSVVIDALNGSQLKATRAATVNLDADTSDKVRKVAGLLGVTSHEFLRSAAMKHMIASSDEIAKRAEEQAKASAARDEVERKLEQALAELK